MKEAVTFRRSGPRPGAKADLASIGWQPTDTPLSQGMAPEACNYYTDTSGKVNSGIWACDAGNVQIKDNAVEEICFVIAGTVKVTDSSGHSETFGAGECLVLPRGFNGIWSQSHGFKKFYVVVEGG